MGLYEAVLVIWARYCKSRIMKPVLYGAGAKSAEMQCPKLEE